MEVTVMNKTLKIVENKKWFYIASVTVILIAIIWTLVAGVNVAIEFKGGTIISYSYTGEISETAVEAAVAEISGQTANVSKSESLADGLKTVVLSFASSEGISAEVQSQITDGLTAEFADNGIELYSSQDVNPSTGIGFFGKCLVAVAFSAVLMIVYIGFRFKKIGGWVAGCCAVVALLHDMCFVYAVFVICGFDINSNFMAVLLTILGYSINATIIIYDRIRENRRLYGSESLGELVNLSVTQTVGRSIHTTVTTVVAMVTVCIVALVAGVESIISFAFPLVIGLLAGVYSSNCIAPTLWVTWQSAIDRRKK